MNRFLRLLFVSSFLVGATTCSAAILTPRNIDTPVHNYCRGMAEALGKGKLDAFKKELVYFFDKIPYSAFAFHTDGQQRTKLLHDTFAWLLCRCITGEDPVVTTDDVTFTAIKHAGGLYVLQFRVIETDSEKDRKPIYTYDCIGYKRDQITVIGITYLINAQKKRTLYVRAKQNNGPDSFHIKRGWLVDGLAYDSDNFYTRMICNLHLEKMTSKSLKKIFDKIPDYFRVSCERYYQSILFFIITLYRWNFVYNEVSTAAGRIDIQLQTDRYNMVIEFKHKGSTSAALAQIDEQQYQKFVSDDAIKIAAINVDDRDESDIKVDVRVKQSSPRDVSPMKPRRRN